MILLLKKPPKSKSKSNPLGLEGENMRIFFMQKLTKDRFKQAVKTGHIIPIQ